ncbi:head decoration protein [Methylococcus mesophilus]|uniref:head decoration protein n=1 Tax=Methylococcus mesophilus TaxID=2993564 RepID=UPI00224B0708|nr:head decoration protein [Methylococcus mesophilus]UZR28089.1 head decoration protein [Methylococcus mesophilus]
MPKLREPKNLGDLLKYEAPNRYSRDLAPVALGQKLALGAVVAREPDGIRLQALDPAATDASAQAVGVLIEAVDATAAEVPQALLLARHAVVSDSALVWPAGINPAQKATAIAQLQALGILVRTGA